MIDSKLIGKTIKAILIYAIKSYQKHISPNLPVSCRFYPSCSQYALEAITKYGAFKGALLSVLRILRCNPLFPGGYDPVK